MIYVVSDIHGRYDKWRKLLETIKPTWADTIYVLGDTIDRGPEGLRTLLDMAQRPNVVHLLGNHEFMLMSVLPTLLAQLTDELVDDLEQNDNAISMLANYMMNGGAATVDELSALNAIDREEIRAYILDMSLFEEFEVRGEPYLLVHAGLDNFAPEKPLEEYGLQDFLWVRPDIRKRYYPDKTVVFGHTPTRVIRQTYGIIPDRESIGEDGMIITDGMIAVDCGCGHGGPLGCLCLDTMERVYV